MLVVLFQSSPCGTRPVLKPRFWRAEYGLRARIHPFPYYAANDFILGPKYFCTIVSRRFRFVSGDSEIRYLVLSPRPHFPSITQLCDSYMYYIVCAKYYPSWSIVQWNFMTWTCAFFRDFRVSVVRRWYQWKTLLFVHLYAPSYADSIGVISFGKCEEDRSEPNPHVLAGKSSFC